MSRIELIGISGQALAGEHWPLLRRCAAIVVSRRHRALVAGQKAELIEITPVSAMLARVEEALERGDVAILASGDPLFFGIGRTLIERFGPGRITVRPALSAMQLACARFHVPWDDLPVLSLHGRDGGDLAGRLLGRGPMLLFTDGERSPDRVAGELLEALKACEDQERIDATRLKVGEDLGLATERLCTGSLAEIAARRFGPLNMVLVDQPGRPEGFSFGLREDEIRHSRGLITKDEVRAATLHRLRLPERGVLWDIGGGSGSVSLEAARLCPELTIRITEKKAEEQANIRANIRRFGTYGIRLVCGEAPSALAGLPAPDRVFVGGSGRLLPAILATAAARLLPGGRIVVNAVLDKTRELALSTLSDLGFSVSAATICVTRQQAEGNSVSFNPITLITGEQ